MGGTGADQGTGIAVSGGLVYVTGSFTGTAFFNLPSTTSGKLTSAGAPTCSWLS